MALRNGDNCPHFAAGTNLEFGKRCNAYRTLDLFLLRGVQTKLRYFASILKLAVCTSYCDMHVPVQCVRLLIAPTILPLSTVCIRSRHARHAGVPSIKDQWASEREISCEFDHTESSERSETLRVGSERFFSLSLERQRSAGEMASFGTYSPPFALDRQQKF